MSRKIKLDNNEILEIETPSGIFILSYSTKHNNSNMTNKIRIHSGELFQSLMISPINSNTIDIKLIGDELK